MYRVYAPWYRNNTLDPLASVNVELYHLIVSKFGAIRVHVVEIRVTTPDFVEIE